MMIKRHTLKSACCIVLIALYATLSWQAIVFIKSYRSWMVSQRVPKVFMAAYDGPTLVISGKILYEKYENGFIAIKVLVSEPETVFSRTLCPFVIAEENIPSPGFYKIRVPKKIGRVDIVAVNLDPEKKSKIFKELPRVLGRGCYKGNPLEVKSQKIEGVDIEMTAGDEEIK
jgi:hypothetical protein